MIAEKVGVSIPNAAIGIAMMLLIAHDYMATLSVQAGNSIKPMMVIWCLGLFIVYRIKRLHITLTYVLTFVALSLVRSVLTHQDFLTAVGPLTGPMYQLFIFFMITDPKTTVSSTKGQILVAFLVGVVEAILRLMQNVHAPYFALFIVGPIANLAEIYLFPSKPKVTATPQPIAVPA